MAKLSKLLFISSCYLISTSIGFAKYTAPKHKLSPNTLKRQINKQTKVIRKLNSEITSLESNLGKSNKRYLSLIEKRRDIETKVYESRQLTKKNEELLNAELIESKKLLTKAVLNSLAESEGGAELVSKKILMDLLSTKIKTIKKQIKVNKVRQLKIESLLTRYRDYSRNEAELSSLLIEMEGKKKQLANTYLNEVKKKETLQSKFSKIRKKVISKKRNKKARRSNIKIRFYTPLEEYTGIEYNKKGITYSFKGQKPVTATQQGKVVYAGSLSNYGNVVMVDHGKETRSIILGQYNPKVKKGQAVKAGDILGYTKSAYNTPGVESKLYFEVRKKNKAQNTIQLMKKEFLVKNNFTNKK
jgi:murein DD-endopeptidase MepM/ murein hydrolase activator NlpD